MILSNGNAFASPSSWLGEIEKAARSGDASAWLQLGRLYLAGREVARDLVRARACFARGAERGHRTAIEVYRAFVANGTGGPPDWTSAVRLLEADRADPAAARQLALLSDMHLNTVGSPVSVPAGEILNGDPRIILFRAFLTDVEADYLAASAAPRFQPALVVHPATGRQIPDPIRTSDLAAFPLALEQPVVHAINRRIAAASGTEVGAGEPLTVLRYRPGQQYRPHLDTLPGVGNQRVATMLVYLNDGFGGGETVFPKLDIRLRARKGDALLFRNVRADGQPDPQTLHEGVAVTAGEKLVASRWIRQAPLIL